MNDFQKTVDLKQRGPARPKKTSPKKAPAVSRAEGIDQVYLDEEDISADLRIISRPANKPAGDYNLFKQMTFVLSALLFVAVFYILVFGVKASPTEKPLIEVGWYAVHLANGEVYYGEVGDKSADPVVVKNVYYNYDQLNPGEKEEEAGGNLRLVKRGKEAHGPDGTMEIVRSQVESFEKLSSESKVLKAILEYEK